jgi:hypothetical protein
MGQTLLGKSWKRLHRGNCLKGILIAVFTQDSRAAFTNPFIYGHQKKFSQKSPMFQGVFINRVNFTQHLRENFFTIFYNALFTSQKTSYLRREAILQGVYAMFFAGMPRQAVFNLLG